MKILVYCNSELLSMNEAAAKVLRQCPTVKRYGPGQPTDGGVYYEYEVDSLEALLDAFDGGVFTVCRGDDGAIIVMHPQDY